MFSSNLQISQGNTNPLTHFTGLRPCHCIFVHICDFALICKGFMGLGLKGTKVKKPQEKCCPFPPVYLVHGSRDRLSSPINWSKIEILIGSACWFWKSIGQILSCCFKTMGMICSPLPIPENPASISESQWGWY